jgi:hypothetical protein
MTTENNNSGDAPQINILPSDSHGDILVQLIRGQERAATALELQNRRLFGGDGQQGSIPLLFQQHKELAAKMDATKDELATKLDDFKTVLTVKIDGVEDKHTALDKKVNWYAGGLAALGTGVTFVLAALGVYHKSH